MSSHDTVEDLLLRWEDARRSGAPITPEELCRGCPERLTELRERIDALISLEAWVVPAAPASGVSGAATLAGQAQTAAAVPAAAGRYRPLRAHARGGLGEVLLAEDGELNRPVALKRLQDHRA